MSHNDDVIAFKRVPYICALIPFLQLGALVLSEYGWPGSVIDPLSDLKWPLDMTFPGISFVTNNIGVISFLDIIGENKQ